MLGWEHSLIQRIVKQVFSQSKSFFISDKFLGKLTLSGVGDAARNDGFSSYMLKCTSHHEDTACCQGAFTEMHFFHVPHYVPCTRLFYLQLSLSLPHLQLIQIWFPDLRLNLFIASRSLIGFYCYSLRFPSSRWLFTYFYLVTSFLGGLA